jgi:hypothetical protein
MVLKLGWPIKTMMGMCGGESFTRGKYKGRVFCGGLGVSLTEALKQSHYQILLFHRLFLVTSEELLGLL